MSDLKTTAHDGDVKAFIEQVENDRRRQDAYRLLAIMEEITGEPARMWGDSIVGFGTYTYRYASGRTGDWMLTGFSPRKASMSVYIMSGFDGYEALIAKLGKHKKGKSCLYINRLEQVDESVLRELIAASVAHMRKQYG
ncbi:MAG: DUF1801 domain-containing protein [Bacteroidetes bacterium]|nr:MAG: DUF1801 domain-containing protein [Bacteroidota bacterium]